MSDYGVFEASTTDGHEEEQQQRQAQRDLGRAIEAAREGFGDFLGAATDKNDYTDRLALVMNDLMQKVADSGVMPVPGVMRKVKAALRPKFRKAASDWSSATDEELIQGLNFIMKGMEGKDYTDETFADFQEALKEVGRRDLMSDARITGSRKAESENPNAEALEWAENYFQERGGDKSDDPAQLWKDALGIAAGEFGTNFSAEDYVRHSSRKQTASSWKEVNPRSEGLHPDNAVWKIQGPNGLSGTVIDELKSGVDSDWFIFGPNGPILNRKYGEPPLTVDEAKKLVEDHINSGTLASHKQAELRPESRKAGRPAGPGYHEKLDVIERYKDFCDQRGLDWGDFEGFMEYTSFAGLPQWQVDHIHQYVKYQTEKRMNASRKQAYGKGEAAAAAAAWAENLGYNDPWGFASWLVDRGHRHPMSDSEYQTNLQLFQKADDPLVYGSRKQASDIDLDDMRVLNFFYQFEDEGLEPSAPGDEQWEWLKNNVDYDILQDKIDQAYEHGELGRGDADSMAYELQQTFFGSRKQAGAGWSQDYDGAGQWTLDSNSNVTIFEEEDGYYLFNNVSLVEQTDTLEQAMAIGSRLGSRKQADDYVKGDALNFINHLQNGGYRMPKDAGYPGEGGQMDDELYDYTNGDQNRISEIARFLQENWDFYAYGASRTAKSSKDVAYEFYKQLSEVGFTGEELADPNFDWDQDWVRDALGNAAHILGISEDEVLDSVGEFSPTSSGFFASRKVALDWSSVQEKVEQSGWDPMYADYIAWALDNGKNVEDTYSFVDYSDLLGLDAEDEQLLKKFIQNTAPKLYGSRKTADLSEVLEDHDVLSFFWDTFEEKGLDTTPSGAEQWEWLKNNLSKEEIKEGIDFILGVGGFISQEQADALLGDLGITASRKTAGLEWDTEEENYWSYTSPDSGLDYWIKKDPADYNNYYRGFAWSVFDYLSGEGDRGNAQSFDEAEQSIEDFIDSQSPNAALDYLGSRKTASKCPKCDGMGRETYEKENGSLSTQTCKACGGTGTAKESRRKTALDIDGSWEEELPGIGYASCSPKAGGGFELYMWSDTMQAEALDVVGTSEEARRVWQEWRRSDIGPSNYEYTDDNYFLGHVKHAGGQDFATFAEGSSAQEAFNNAKAEAQRMYGDSGYTGSIAEKDSFEMASRTPMSEEEARKFIWNGDGFGKFEDKWGPAGCIELDTGGFVFFGVASS